MSRDPDTSIGGRPSSEDIGTILGALSVLTKTGALPPTVGVIGDPYGTHPP